MAFDIFQVDWITVDIIIIILLVLLLIGVKVLKEVYRWRFFFTNASTIRRVDKNPNINAEFASLIIKKCSLTKSTVSQREDLIKPIIIITRSYRKFMLLKAFTEAFCSFGYFVINVRFKTPAGIGTNEIALENEKELQQTIPGILKFYDQDIDTLIQDYNVIDFSKRLLPYNLLLMNSNCKNLFLINPRVKPYNLKLLKTLLKYSNDYPQLITIFSENLNPVLKNKNINKILLYIDKSKNAKHNIIQKSKSTFKFYETILLSKIIRYIEK